MADNEQKDDQFAPWTPHIDPEQAAKGSQELAKLHSSIGILQDFFDDLERDIEAYRGTDMIAGVNVSTDPNDLKLAVLVNNTVKGKLTELRDKYRVQYGQYMEETND